MRTLIRGGWVVGFDKDHHTLVTSNRISSEG